MRRICGSSKAAVSGYDTQAMDDIHSDLRLL